MRPSLLLWSLFSALCLLQIARADLAATLSSGGKTDTRSDRLPAILVKPGETPSPFLAPGPFQVDWSGKLVIPARQRLIFSFEGEGTATLKIDGEEVLSESGVLGSERSQRLRLNPGEHELSIQFKSKEDGSGRFRLFWEERSFPRQSAPPSAFKTDGKIASPERLGRELFASHHCAKCHLPASGFGATPMPEMLAIAPLLSATGTRLNEKWLAEWIAAPASLKPGTRMPALVDPATDEGRQQAADLAAWLMTFKIGEPAAAPAADLARIGGEHFHRLGCVACHSRPDQPDLTSDRLPLRFVADKFQPGALVDFLKKPDQWYPHTGMPDFGLSDEEAGSLAAYLIHSAKPERELPAFPAGDASKGAALSQQLNCGACHAGLPFDPASAPPLDAIFKADWAATGCVQGGGNHPHMNLNDDEKAALVAFSKTGSEPLGRRVPAEYATRQIHALRCTGCHSLDDQRSLLETTHIETNDLVAHVAGENEKLDQSRPSLTYLGEMLHSSYIRKMLDGKADPRARPWLDMRMPAFPIYAPELAEGLARLHGVEPGSPAAPNPDADLAAIGRSLTVGADGFGCTTCHGVGDMAPTAAFEVEGTSFNLTHERLRHEYFTRWMADPRSVTPDTKMPRYSENGESQRTDILDGDAAAQFEAIWNYLQAPTP